MIRSGATGHAKSSHAFEARPTMKPIAVVACGIALALLPVPLLAGSRGNAQSGGPGDGPDRWRFEFVPYLWFASLDGSIGLDPLPTVRVSADLPDPLVNLDFAVSDTFTAHRGRWTVLSDISFTKLGVDETVSSSHIQIDSGLIWASLAGGYAVLDAPASRIELLAGARYTLMNNDGESTGGVTGSNTSSEQWIDPIVGINARANLAQRLSVGLLANVGGFGVGSDLSYEFMPRVTYTWNEIITLNAGYRLVAMDFDSSGVKYDVREFGWLFGVGFNF
jgi:hypothetical protein